MPTRFEGSIIPSNIHDSTIKYFLSDRLNAISLLKSMLPKEIVKQLDFNKIHYEKDSYLPKIAETEIDEGEEYMGTIAEMFRREGREEIRTEYENKINGLKNEWFGQAKLEYAHENLIDVATEAYGPLPDMLHEKIRSIQSLENLRALNRKVIRTQSLEEFTELVNRAAQ